MLRCAVVLGLLLGWPALVEAGPESLDAGYRARREALMKEVGSGIILVLGAEKNASYSQFRQTNRFYYLTGIDEPAAALVLLPGKNRHVLFLTPTPTYMVRWEGAGLSPGKEVNARYGMDESLLYEDLPSFLNELLGKKKVTLWLPLAPEETGRVITDSTMPLHEARRNDMLDERLSREENLSEKLTNLFPEVKVLNLSPHIRAMRTVKSAWELDRMRKAAAVSEAGWKHVLRLVRPGMFEYQLGAILGFHAKMAGGSDFPYWPIVGSGPNANTMHYIANRRRLEAGDLVLMDAAYGFGYYAMDITRTFPVSGRFSDEQKKIYQDLLDVQKTLISMVRPGISLFALNSASEEMLAKKGYKGKTVHFLGHFIGMAVHDPGDVRAPLVPGNVITIEPGLYFPQKGMGIRIEDVVALTQTGCEVLSRAVPKEVHEIEALWKGKKD